MADPQTNTVGLLSVYAVHQAMSRTTPDAGIAQLQALTLRSRLEDSTADPADKLARLAADTNTADAAYDAGVFPITAQQLAVYQHGKHLVSLTGAPPVDGLIDADYPFAIAKGADHQAADRQAAHGDHQVGGDPGRLQHRGHPGRAQLCRRRSRICSSRPAVDAVPHVELPDAAADRRLGLDEREDQRPGRAHHHEGRAAARSPARRRPNCSARTPASGSGCSARPRASSPAHQEVVPLGPLSGALDGKTRRAALIGAMGSYKAADKAGTPLYQTVLDGRGGHAESRPSRARSRWSSC